MRRTVRRYALIVIVGSENEFGIPIALNGVTSQSVNAWKSRINNASAAPTCLFVPRGGKTNAQSMHEEEYLPNRLLIATTTDSCCYSLPSPCHLFVMKGSNETQSLALAVGRSFLWMASKLRLTPIKETLD